MAMTSRTEIVECCDFVLDWKVLPVLRLSVVTAICNGCLNIARGFRTCAADLAPDLRCYKGIGCDRLRNRRGLSTSVNDRISVRAGNAAPDYRHRNLKNFSGGQRV